MLLRKNCKGYPECCLHHSELFLGYRRTLRLLNFTITKWYSKRIPSSPKKFPLRMPPRLQKTTPKSFTVKKFYSENFFGKKPPRIPSRLQKFFGTKCYSERLFLYSEEIFDYENPLPMPPRLQKPTPNLFSMTKCQSKKSFSTPKTLSAIKTKMLLPKTLLYSEDFLDYKNPLRMPLRHL